MSHRQRSLAGYSPYGLEELDMTEHTRSGREGSDSESGTFKELKPRKPPSELKPRFPKLQPGIFSLSLRPHGLPSPV